MVEFRPVGFDMILGMNGILSLGGVSVSPGGGVCFGDRLLHCCSMAVAQEDKTGEIVIDEKDFRAVFDERSRSWTVSWKWATGEEPDILKNTISQYKISAAAKCQYDKEIERWIELGWLIPFDESILGPAKGLIPMMAVNQKNGRKVRPVMDYGELNQFLDVHTAEADVCAEKLREWRRRGERVSLVDLKDAYLQLKVDESLWCYQTVECHGKRFCLTRLGFGLSVAPMVMKAVLAAVLEMREDVRQGTSSYVDDILIDENVVSPMTVIDHLRRYGLTCKSPVCLYSGAKVLGVCVGSENGIMQWSRNQAIPEVPTKITRRSIFSWCGRVTSHLPVYGYVRPACSYIKRRATAVTSTWDEDINDDDVRSIVLDLKMRCVGNDPAKGRWEVTNDEATVWVDASSLALGVVLEVDGNIVEDACWLRQNQDAHINMAELDAVLKGVNLAVAWKITSINLMTDSSSVYHWLSDAVSGKARLKTKASGELLIRRRVSTFQSIVKEYDLTVSVHRVSSADNRADALTRVLNAWLRNNVQRQSPDQRLPISAACVNDDVLSKVARIHHDTGHPGVRRTCFFCKKSQCRCES